MRSRTIARNSFLTAIDLAAGLLSGIFVSVLVGRAMGPAILGDYSFLLWGISTVTLLASLGLPTAMWKHASHHRGAGHMDQAITLIRVGFWAQAALTLVILAFIIVWLVFFSNPATRPYTAPALLAIAPAFLIAALTSAISVSEDMTWLVMPSIAATFITFVIVLLTLHYGWGLPGLAWSLLLPRVVDFAIRFWGFHRIYGQILFPPEGPFNLNGIPPEEARSLLRYAGQVTLLMLVQAILWSRSEVWFLKKFRTPSEVSYFSLSFNFLDKINMLPQIIANAVGVSVMVESGRDKRQAGRIALTGLRYIALFTAPLTLGLCAIAYPLILTLYGNLFLPAVVPLMIQGILLVPRIFLYPTNNMLYAADRVDLLIKWGLALSAFNLALDAALVPWGGAPGAAWANGLAQATATFVIWRATLKEYDLSFPWSGVLRITGVAALMAALVWLATWPLPPKLALIAGVPVGAILYPLLLRLLGALDTEDARRLLTLEHSLPRSLRAPYGRLIHALTGVASMPAQAS